MSNDPIKYTFDTAKDLLQLVRSMYGIEAARLRLAEGDPSRRRVSDLLGINTSGQVKTVIDGILKIYPHLIGTAQGYKQTFVTKKGHPGEPTSVLLIDQRERVVEAPPVPTYTSRGDVGPLPTEIVAKLTTPKELLTEQDELQARLDAAVRYLGMPPELGMGYEEELQAKLDATTTPTGRKDDYIDGAAYFGLAGECALKESK